MSETNAELVEGLHFGEKMERSFQLIDEAWRTHGEGLVVADSLGKDSAVTWHLAKRVSPKIRGFIVTTRYKPRETKQLMREKVAQYPELRVFSNDSEQPEARYSYDPDGCCFDLKVLPARWAVEEMEATCWVTGLRCAEGRTRTDLDEIEERDVGLVKLNPILLWYEMEMWKYIALHQLPVNPLYAAGYRSLGCALCTSIVAEGDDRAGRCIGTSKCGGECGIHTKPLLVTTT